MYRMIVRHLTIGIVLMCLVLTSCKVTKPLSDGTPPVFKWHVLNSSTGDSVDIVGDGAFYAKPNDAIAITLKAEDPEGVSYISSGGGGTKSCHGKGVAYNEAIGSTFHQEQYLYPDAQGKVETLAFLLLNTTSSADCRSGYSFTGTRISIHGTGRNYFSGETISTLTIFITP